jgi:hypothetical protein
MTVTGMNPGKEMSMRVRNTATYAAKTAIAAAISAFMAVSPALATVTGSLTVQNGTTGVIPGTIVFNGCNTNATYVKCLNFQSLTPGSSGTATVVDSNDGQGSHFANTDVYIYYYANGDHPGVIQTPQCTWQVQVTSDMHGNYSGMVHTFAQSDFGYNNGAGYTPTCSYSGFSVNGGTGNWTLSLDWSH